MAYEHCMLVQQKLVILVAFTNIECPTSIWVHVSDIQTALPGHIVLWAFSFNLYVALSLFEGILSISDLDKNTCQHCNIEGTSPYLQLGSKICLWLLVILCACRGLSRILCQLPYGATDKQTDTTNQQQTTSVAEICLFEVRTFWNVEYGPFSQMWSHICLIAFWWFLDTFKPNKNDYNYYSIPTFIQKQQ